LRKAAGEIDFFRDSEKMSLYIGAFSIAQKKKRKNLLSCYINGNRKYCTQGGNRSQKE
jgi:hypothetical protein